MTIPVSRWTTALMCTTAMRPRPAITSSTSTHCAGCHGDNAKGTPLAPDLTANKRLWGDGNYKSIVKTIRERVASPKQHTGVMPPMGGA